MNLPVERIVTIEPLNTERNWKRYGVVNFTIEPPIIVHDSKFLDRAVQAVPGSKSGPNGYALINKVDLTFSDYGGTHGTMEVQNEADHAEVQRVVGEAFTSALGVGMTAIQFSTSE